MFVDWCFVFVCVLGGNISFWELEYSVRVGKRKGCKGCIWGIEEGCLEEGFLGLSFGEKRVC